MAANLLNGLFDPQLLQIPDAPLGFNPDDAAKMSDVNVEPPQNSIQKAQGTQVPTFSDVMKWLDSYEQKSPPNPVSYGSSQTMPPLRGIDLYRNLASTGQISGSEFNRTTGRISGYAPQSPRDTTPSGRGITPGSEPTGGFSSNWADFFQGHMDKPPTAIRPSGGYSWEPNYPKAGGMKPMYQPPQIGGMSVFNFVPLYSSTI